MGNDTEVDPSTSTTLERSTGTCDRHPESMAGESIDESPAISLIARRRQRQRRMLDDSLIDCRIALRDEYERCLRACGPIVREQNNVEARLRFLDWLDEVQA